AACGRARRAQARCAGAVSAATGRARSGGAAVERLVRSVRAARRPRHADRAFRNSAWRGGHMIRLFPIPGALLAVSGLAGHSDRGFQGWVEADLIFVSPDESGRVETLSVREGDPVQKDAPLFTVDSELQRDSVAMAEAALTNARQAFERAQALVKTAAGTQ